MDADKLHHGSLDEKLAKQADDLLDLLREQPRSTEVISTLNELLVEHPQLREHVATQLSDEAMLISELQVRAAEEQFCEKHGQVAHSNLLEFLEESLAEKTEATKRPTMELAQAAKLANGLDLEPTSSQHWWDFRTTTLWASFAGMFLLGIVSTSLVARFWGSTAGNQAGMPPLASYGNLPLADKPFPGETDSNSANANYVAHVVRGSDSVLHDTKRRSYAAGAGLRAGQILRLPSGIAKLSLNNGLELSIEGPAEFEFQANGVPLLKYGKLYAQAPWGAGEYQIDTHLASLDMQGATTTGFVLFGGSLQVHNFEGNVQLRRPDAQFDHELDLLAPAQARQLSLDYESSVYIADIALEPSLFASRRSMASDQLEIPQSYVHAIMDSKPYAYWRFESSNNRLVTDEVSGKRNCVLLDGARIVPQLNNSVVEFGYGSNSGSASIKKALGEFGRDAYSLECWVKASHFHRCTLMSFVQKDPNASKEKHGLLLELCGPFYGLYGNSVRFLHRNPPGESGGVECFSTKDYHVRAWQHLVAVKEGPTMRIYLNGKLVAEDFDSTPLISGLSLIVGRLYSSDTVRPFVGQLDELAIYDRALSEEQVQRHHALARGSQELNDEIDID